MASANCKIAIVGMACRLPGGIDEPNLLWNALKNKECTMEDIPRERFNIDDYWTPSAGQRNKMVARKGHFIRDGALFDEAFFKMSPREARNADPQHRVLLETVVDALDDAGYKPHDDGGEEGWVKSRLGVFIGSATDSYQNNLAADIDAFFAPATIRGFASGRISHHFGWQGPANVYDAACSSGLLAVHAACQSLVLHESDAALACGTNMLTSPEMFIGLSKGFFISNTGGCRTFDESGDGYCRADGVGALVLKRLDDAIRDRDHIHSIIAASGINQSGPSESLTTPHAPTQTQLFKANCDRANISPLAIRAVEAHGTGTQAGDYQEMLAIKSSFCNERPPHTSDNSASTLYVASLKPNLGHSESAAGLIGVIKGTLMLRNRSVLPHIGISTRLNPRLGSFAELAENGIAIPTEMEKLEPTPGYENIFISVNSFGAPGSNANVILEETSTTVSPPVEDPRKHHVVVLSAKAHTSFSLITERFLNHLDKHDADMSLASLAYTTTARRVDYPCRVALAVASIEELKEKLKKISSPQPNDGNNVPKIGFLVGGNGSQYQGMGKVLYQTSPVFRTCIDDCDALLRRIGGQSLLGIIRGETDPSGQDRETSMAVSASIFSVEYGLGTMWMEWGVKPAVILGHSLGEVACLVLAKVLTVNDAIELIVARVNGLYAHDVSSLDGAMLAMGVPTSEAQALLEKSGCTGLEISCHNGPAQTCVSGPRNELVKLRAFCKALPDPPLSKILPGHYASHTSAMSPGADAMQAMAENLSFSAAATPVILNVDGSVLQIGEVPSKSYLSEQTVKPVLFEQCAKNPLAQEVDIWIEISAKAILLPLLRSIVPAGKALLPTIGGSDDESWLSISKALARLYEAHVPINWAKYHAPYPVKLVSLPSYPFTRNRHWVDYEDRLHRQSSPTPKGVVGDVVQTSLGALEIVDPWKKYQLTTGTLPLDAGAYLWLALTCTSHTRILDFQLKDAENLGSYLIVTVNSHADVCDVLFTRADLSSSEKGSIVAKCRMDSPSFTNSSVTDIAMERSRTKLRASPCASVLSQSIVASVALSMGPKAPRHLQSLRVAGDGKEALGRLEWKAQDLVREVLHPSVSKVPLGPSQLNSLLQPAYLTAFLTSGTSPVQAQCKIEQLELNPSIGNLSAVDVHMLFANQDAPVAHSFVCSDSGSTLVRITGHSLDLPGVITPAEIVVKPFASVEVAPISPPQRVSPPTEPASPTKSVSPPVESPSSGDSDTAASEITSAEVIPLLAQELGIPPYSISTEDKLEDLGVDSIMSLLLRDKVGKLAGRRLKWFVWRKGITVNELCDYVEKAQIA